MASNETLQEQGWLRVTLDSVNDAVFTLDADGRVTFLNGAAARLAAAGPEAVPGRRLGEILRMRDEGSGQDMEVPGGWGDWTAGPVTRRVRIAGTDGAERYADATLRAVSADSGIEGAVLVLRDVTERLLAEQAMRESEERYRVFVEQSSEGIWRFELASPVPVGLSEDEQLDLFYRDAVLAECNQVMARMYGFSEASELIGTRLDDLLPRSDPHNVKYLRAFIRSGYRLAGAESHEHDKDGSPKYFLNNLIGVVENGLLVRAWGTQLDITDQKKMEDELRRRADELVAADRRKDQFLAMLAHELRNPLAPIRNAVELMRQAETVDPSFHPSREMVERQVKHLARLVDDLLDVSRITRGNIRLRKEPVDLGTVVQRAIDSTRTLIDSRAHELTVELPSSPVRLEADSARLEQVISNLLNNAAKYTMPGGHIWVTAEKEGEEALIRVRDNGIGVPPDVLGRVFEPFVQSDGSLARSEGGLGIGLTLVRSLVEMHGGSVEAQSPGLGQGSEFVVRLPVRIPQAIAETNSRPLEGGALAPGKPVRVLVVEDNLDAAESLATLLRIWGHEVHVVHDGLQALEAAREQRPEVVLLDIGLPGLDGYQVAERLRQEAGLDGALLVAMTGYGQPEDRRRSREAGIHHHFVKPVEPFVLKNLLADVASPVGSRA